MSTSNTTQFFDVEVITFDENDKNLYSELVQATSSREDFKFYINILVRIPGADTLESHMVLYLDANQFYRNPRPGSHIRPVAINCGYFHDIDLILQLKITRSLESNNPYTTWPFVSREDNIKSRIIVYDETELRHDHFLSSHLFRCSAREMAYGHVPRPTPHRVPTPGVAEVKRHQRPKPTSTTLDVFALEQAAKVFSSPSAASSSDGSESLVRKTQDSNGEDVERPRHDEFVGLPEITLDLATDEDQSVSNPIWGPRGAELWGPSGGLEIADAREADYRPEPSAEPAPTASEPARAEYGDPCPSVLMPPPTRSEPAIVPGLPPNNWASVQHPETGEWLVVRKAEMTEDEVNHEREERRQAKHERAERHQAKHRLKMQEIVARTKSLLEKMK